MKKIAIAAIAALALTACGDAGEAAFQEIWDSGTDGERGLVCAIYLDDPAVVDELMIDEMDDKIDRTDVKAVLDRECA